MPPIVTGLLAGYYRGADVKPAGGRGADVWRGLACQMKNCL